MLRKLHPKSQRSTAVCSPTQSPHNKPIKKSLSPTVLQESLRLKNSEKTVVFPKTARTVRKAKLDSLNPMTMQKRQINWIIYNILVGIYYNWLRLAPYILHYVRETKKDKISDIQKMIENIEEEKCRLEDRLRNKRYGDGRDQDRQGQDYGNQEMLGNIKQYCNQVKHCMNSQIMNGQLLATRRLLKADKQNLLTDNIIGGISHGHGHKNDDIKITILSSDIEKVAQTIVDRIEVVRYMRRNNIKCGQRLLRPLKTIFKDMDGISRSSNMTTEQVIQKLKTKFNISDENTKTKAQEQAKLIKQKNKKKTQVRTPTVKRILHDQQMRRQQKNEKKQKQINQCVDSFSDSNRSKNQSKNKIDSRTILNKSVKVIEYKIKTNKKIGFIAQQNVDSGADSNTQADISFSKVFRSKNELHTQRRLATREVMKNNMKSNKKLQFPDSKQKQKRITNKSRQKSQIKSKADIKSRQKIQSKRKIERLASIKNEQSYKKITQQKIKESAKKTRNNISSFSQSQSEQQKQGIQINKSNTKRNRFVINHSQKKIKPGKLLKKKKVLKFSQLFGNFDLQNFDDELKAEDSVLNKKRKILNLFRGLQNSGLINTKSIRKIVTHAKKLQQELKNSLKKTKNGKDKKTDSFPITSFFRIICEQQKQQKQKPAKQFCPYKFLTAFNKQALQNWRQSKTNRQRNSKDLIKPLDFQKHRAFDIDCDLQIPIVRKQQIMLIRNSHSRRCQKQRLGIQISLSMIKKWQKQVVKQKGLDYQRRQNQE